MVFRGVYILCHQGLGDHILCNGIYREYAQRYKKCVIPVVDKYYRVVKRMVSDVENIQVVRFNHQFWTFKMEAHANLLNSFGYDTLSLGVFGPEFFLDKSKRLDANFYHQAALPLNTRWESFGVKRDLIAEDKLFKLLIGNSKEYVFLHDDKKRKFIVDSELLPRDMLIVEPDEKLKNKFSFFDYLKIIENAKEIHCIESSFAALIESLEFNIPKYAHRYARPEAKNDFRHEFTYRSKWHVYK
jgi:hypothetical protein